MNFLHKWDGDFTSFLAINSLIEGYSYAARSHKSFNNGLTIDQSFKYNYPTIKNLTRPVNLPWLKKLGETKNVLFTFYNNGVRPSYLIPDVIRFYKNVPKFCYYRDLSNIRTIPINRNDSFNSNSDQLLSRYQIEKMFGLLGSCFTPVAAKIKILSRFQFEANLNERDIQRIRKDYIYDFSGIQGAFTQMDEERLKLIPNRVIFSINYGLIVPDFLKKVFMNFALKRIDSQYSHARYAFMDNIYQESIRFFHALSKKDETYKILFKEWIQLNIGMIIKKTSLSSESYKEYVFPLEGILCSYYANPPQTNEEKVRLIQELNEVLVSEEALRSTGGTLKQYISIAESVLGWTDLDEQEPYAVPFILSGEEKDIV